ncbi:MAG: XrtA/PEP-CTERM system-associated ATPase [Rhodospirillaceae bacterium]
MFDEFYRLSGSPFRLSPDPRFFFGSRSHTKAMAYLHYGLQQREGFIAITGRVGTGKSMLISHLLSRLDLRRVVAANITTSQVEPEDMLQLIAAAFNVLPAARDKATLIRALEAFLLQQHGIGRHVLAVIDEAQNLPLRTIEEIRMLSNLVRDGQSLLQIFLVGQPQFSALLANPALEQLRQRVIASYSLEPLSSAETRHYIEHRLGLVGWSDDPSISESAFCRIFEETGGLPRRINTVCSRLFLLGALDQRHHLGDEEVDVVIDDLHGEMSEMVAGPAPIPQN